MKRWEEKLGMGTWEGDQRSEKDRRRDMCMYQIPRRYIFIRYCKYTLIRKEKKRMRKKGNILQVNRSDSI